MSEKPTERERAITAMLDHTPLGTFGVGLVMRALKMAQVEFVDAAEQARSRAWSRAWHKCAARWRENAQQAAAAIELPACEGDCGTTGNAFERGCHACDMIETWESRATTAERELAELRARTCSTCSSWRPHDGCTDCGRCADACRERKHCHDTWSCGSWTSKGASK